MKTPQCLSAFACLLLSIVLLVGCSDETTIISGGGSNDTPTNETPTDETPETPNGVTNAVGFSVLAAAKIALAEYDATQGWQLIDQVSSTDSGDYADQGEFTLDYSELNDNQWYLLTASDGVERDKDQDGQLDTYDTDVKGVLRSLAKGRWLKAQSGSHISIATELAYQRVKDQLIGELDAAALEEALNQQAVRILNDQSAKAIDLLEFHPKNDADSLDLYIVTKTAQMQGLWMEGSSINLAFMPYQERIELNDKASGEGEYVLNADETFVFQAAGSSGLHRINLASFEVTTFKPETVRVKDRLTYNAHENRIYTPITGGGIGVFDVETQSFLTPLLDAVNVRDVKYCESTKTLYALNRTDLIVYDTETQSHATSTVNDTEFLSLSADCSEIYLLQDEALEILDAATFAVKESYTLGYYASNVAELSNGLLLATYDSGLSYIDRSLKTVTEFSAPNDQEVYSVTPTASANVFYVLTEYEVFKFNTQTLAYESQTPAFSNPEELYAYYGVYSSRHDLLVFGYELQIANHYNGRNTVLDVFDNFGTTQALALSDDQKTLYYTTSQSGGTLVIHDTESATEAGYLTGVNAYFFVVNTAKNTLVMSAGGNHLGIFDLSNSTFNQYSFSGSFSDGALDQVNQRYYVDNTDDNTIDIIDLNTNSFVESLDYGCSHVWGQWLTLSQDNSQLLSSCTFKEDITVYDILSKTDSTISTPHRLVRFSAYDNDNTFYYFGDDEITKHNLANDSYVTLSYSDQTLFTIKEVEGTHWVIAGGNSALVAINFATGEAVDLYRDYANEFVIKGSVAYIAASSGGIVKLDLSDLY
ncbi:MAG: hypothetical protein OXE99_02050 [Cellvibrionales bacterium]|nr:hypothetical protein [Cellvibrionales bacterium]